MKTETTNPPGKAAAANDLDAARSDAAAKRNEELAHRLFALQRKHEWSDDRLGRMLAGSGTYVSRYRNNNFTGDLVKFENAVHQLLMKEELMEGDDVQISADGFCVDSVRKFLEFIYVNRHMGVGHGDAGKGKTCAARWYASQHPTSVYIHVWDWSCSRDKFISCLAATARVTAKRGENLAEALVRTFRDADRIIIIDNAQRLTERCRKFLIDFHDATRTPIALIGNPEIVQQFRRNDQHKSRLGRCEDVTLPEAERIAETGKKTILTLLETYLPEARDDKEAQSACLSILREPSGGAARAVRNVLRLSRRMRSADQTLRPLEAIRLAETKLLKEAA